MPLGRLLPAELRHTSEGDAMRILSIALPLSHAVWLPVRAGTAYTVTFHGHDTPHLVVQARVGPNDPGSDAVDDPSPRTSPTFAEHSAATSGKGVHDVASS